MSNTKKYKILFYTDTPLYGGAEHQLYLLVKHLNNQKFTPIIVTRKSPSLETWHQKIRQEKINLIITNTKSKNSIQNYFELKKIIQKEKPNLIHAQIWNPMASKYAFLIAKKHQIPLVITEHDPFKLNFLKNIYKKLTLKIPQKIITVSKANQKLMALLYPQISQKLITIHNGIEENKTKLTTQEKNHIRKNIFKANTKSIIIFSAGTLHPRKGYKYLIQAIKKISNKYTQIKLVIAGDGPEKKDLENLIFNLNLNDKIILLGQRNDINQLMQSADVFVLPSIKEAFGLVILEAMQNNLPIIASKIGGIPEIIQSKNNGILTLTKDPQSLSQDIETLITNKGLRKKMIKNNQKYWKNFSANKMAIETTKVYNQILK